MAFTPAQKAHERISHQVFQPPPISPHDSIQTSSDYFSSLPRKRQRPDSSHDERTQQSSWTATPSWARCSTPSDAMHMSSAAVNGRYCLAGGFDTPGLLATSDYGRQEQEWCRRNVRDAYGNGETTEAAQDGGRTNTQHIYGPLARERNGVARLQSSPNGDAARGWASYAFQLVGQAFAFGSGMIRGFYSGGGKGYDLDQQSLSDSWQHSRPPLRRQRRGSTPVPGQWQDDEFLGDLEQDNPDSPTNASTRPPNKRRQTDKDSWVMVGTPEATVDMSPKRKTSAAHRASVGARPAGASRANSRRSLLPVSRRQSGHILQTSSPAQSLTTTTTTNMNHETPTSHINKRASIAATRLPNTSNSRPSSSSGLATQNQNDTYISPETARLLKRQAKQEKAADKAMSSMSKRLEDLIRQGQEALGTKVAVEGEGVGEDGSDEGFVDEAW